MQKITHMTLNLPTDLVVATKQLIKIKGSQTIDEFVALALQHELLKVGQLTQNNQDWPEDMTIVDDPIWGLGENPVKSGLEDASENID